MAVDLAVALTLWTADYLQTRTVAKEPYVYAEAGGSPGHMMGTHPSTDRVTAYFAAGAAVIGGTYYALPKPWSQVAMGLVIGNEAVNLRHNMLAGVKFTF
jgi:hypothetical protein